MLYNNLSEGLLYWSLISTWSSMYWDFTIARFKMLKIAILKCSQLTAWIHKCGASMYSYNFMEMMMRLLDSVWAQKQRKSCSTHRIIRGTPVRSILINFKITGKDKTDAFSYRFPMKWLYIGKVLQECTQELTISNRCTMLYTLFRTFEIECNLKYINNYWCSTVHPFREHIYFFHFAEPFRFIWFLRVYYVFSLCAHIHLLCV